ncbi:MAG: ChpI protein [Sporichthyaceae bacterium]
MKIAVSVPDELFAQADAVAERLGLNRSQLYARALEQFLAAYGADPVTLALDRLADESEPGVGAAAGRRLIEDGAWEW